MKHHLTLHRAEELQNKASKGDTEAQAELDSYAREKGFDSWDEYWHFIIRQLREAISNLRIAFVAGVNPEYFDQNWGTRRKRLITTLQALVDRYGEDPAFQALRTRSEDPAVQNDPVLSVAMRNLEDKDIGELLDEIREMQGHPPPITLQPIPSINLLDPGQKDSEGDREDQAMKQGFVPTRIADLDRWRIVWKHIKRWVVINGWTTEQILKGLRIDKLNKSYSGPLVKRDTLNRIIKAGKSGKLESQ